MSVDPRSRPRSRLEAADRAHEALREEGVEALWDRLAEHRSHLETDGLLDERRREHLAAEVFAVVGTCQDLGAPCTTIRAVLEAVQRRELDPLSAVDEILEKVFGLTSDGS